MRLVKLLFSFSLKKSKEGSVRRVLWFGFPMVRDRLLTCHKIYLQNYTYLLPFVVAIKPSQVSPCSSKSLATQDTPVRILTSSNDIYFPDTSSLFHEGTVSSSVQPSAFPSSSVQMEGKERKFLFSKLQASLQSIFQCNFFKCRFTTFQFKFGFVR